MKTMYVSTDGNDAWSGLLPEPRTDGSDGPFATVARAREAVREMERADQRVVQIRGGRYEIAEPLLFGPEDSAVTYAAYDGEQPVIDGGRRITDWSMESTGSRDIWVANMPLVAAGKWYFRELFVNGARRPRTRLPREGFYVIESVPGIDLSAELFDGSNAFVAVPGDMQNWHNITDVDVVALHWWVEERMPIESFDEATRTVTSSRRSIFALKDDQCRHYARYYVENVFEALTEPGQWYLDRTGGKLYYIPLSGETPETAEVYAPAVTQFIKVLGDADRSEYVVSLRFEGLTFRHADWVQSPLGSGVGEDSPLADADYASAPQAAANVPAVISFEAARDCAVEDCRIEHIGLYGISLLDGCTDNRVVGNEISDIGAGGITMNGSDADGPLARRTGNNTITDNHIWAGGRVFHSAVGILSRHSFGNLISHNHIHDLFYTGISCGWVWSYQESVSKNNRIEKNHIHDLGQGLLSDMGGIYTLGVQPGTVLAGNLIHDIRAYNYGGWAIYPDQSSSHMIIRDNICYNTTSHVYYQNSVRSNILLNNIFAFGGMGLVGFATGEMNETDEIGHLMTLQGNILITDGQPVVMVFTDGFLNDHGFLSDTNVLWDVSRAPVVSGYFDTTSFFGRWCLLEAIGIDDWRELGYDRHSVIAEPGLEDPADLTSALRPDSPALTLGFRPIDSSDVGPRFMGKRE